jgi:hypothetical protein
MDVYTAESLPQPVEKMRKFRKTTLTPMWFVRGPFVVETLGGAVATVPEGWEGYLAIDTHGHPYPIEKGEQEQIYEEVFD